MRDKEFYDGVSGYRINKTLDNPHKPGSKEYNEYERGWVQALKRSSVKFSHADYEYLTPYAQRLQRADEIRRKEEEKERVKREYIKAKKGE